MYNLLTNLFLIPYNINVQNVHVGAISLPATRQKVSKICRLYAIQFELWFKLFCWENSLCLFVFRGAIPNVAPAPISFFVV